MKFRKHGVTHDNLVNRYERDPAFREAWAIERIKAVLAANVLMGRTAGGLTQEQLAEAAGMRQPRVAEIESGDANCQLETLARLATALRVSVWELLTDPESKTVPEDRSSVHAVYAAAPPDWLPTGGMWVVGAPLRSVAVDKKSGWETDAVNEGFALSS
jgi:transcriptional regulator with XRE-family HTH domain